MKKAFWLLALGALASAVMAASIGRAEDAPVGRQASGSMIAGKATR